MLFKFIICLSFVHSGVPCVPGQWTDHPGLLFVHQRPVHLPGGGEGGVRASHRSAVRDLLRLQPLHDLCGLSGYSRWPAGEVWVCHGFIISVYFCASWVLCCPLLLPSCVHAQPAVPSTSALHQLSCPALFLLFFPSLSPSSLLFCSSHHSPQLRFHLASPAPHSLVALVYILILCRVVCWVCMWSPAFHPHITVIMTPKLFPFLPRENPALTTRLMAVCSLWSVRLRSKPTSLSPRFRATSPDLSTWHMVPSFQSASLPCLISLSLVSLQPPCPEWTKPPACWPPAHSIRVL